MMTYASSEISDKLNAIVKIADETQTGCFIFIRNYRGSNGELANYWLHYGRDYVHIKEHLIEEIKGILWKDKPFSIDVSYWTWLDDDGEHAKKAEGRKEVRVTLKSLDIRDDDLKQALRSMLRRYAVHQMRQARSGTGRPKLFDRQAKGIYIDRKGNIHFRMSTIAHKNVIEPSDERKYSIRKSAIAQALRDRFLKLKAFKLGSFESMSIGGQIVEGALVQAAQVKEGVER